MATSRATVPFGCKTQRCSAEPTLQGLGPTASTDERIASGTLHPLKATTHRRKRARWGLSNAEAG